MLVKAGLEVWQAMGEAGLQPVIIYGAMAWVLVTLAICKRFSKDECQTE